MVDGRARLLREDYCDGLGDCLPACPVGAISFEVREAPPMMPRRSVPPSRPRPSALPLPLRLPRHPVQAYPRVPAPAARNTATVDSEPLSGLYRSNWYR